jgi:LmeA-like phospholipid-binding
MPNNPGLGEQALNKAAEVGITSQLDEVENLDVEVKTDPLKLIQGEVDSVKIEGEGLVMQNSLRVEELQMQVKDVAINPLSVAFGKIELTKPTQGSAKVVLTEADINRAFNSDYIRNKLQSKKIDISGQPVAISLEDVDFRLPGNNRVELKANVKKDNNENHKVAFSAVPTVSKGGKVINLEEVEYPEGEDISSITKPLVDATSEILNLDNFDLQGMELKIKGLYPEVGQLVIAAEAYVEQIPSA